MRVCAELCTVLPLHHRPPEASPTAVTAVTAHPETTLSGDPTGVPKDAERSAATDSWAHVDGRMWSHACYSALANAALMRLGQSHQQGQSWEPGRLRQGLERGQVQGQGRLMLPSACGQ